MEFTTTNSDHASAETLAAEPNPLNITIVGAGIGGLSAAIFLRQQGHQVTLLEQSRFANELGAAVHLAPNANGLLKRMGLVAEETGANEALVMSQYLPNGHQLFSVDLEKTGEIWQHKWLLAHRVHIHAELKRRATMEEGEGKASILRTGSKVVDVDTEGRVTLASGEVIEADVVIGADGVHSKTRERLPGAKGINPFGSGKSAFRFVIERKKALDNEETRALVEKDGHLQMIFGRDRRVIIYPTSHNSLLNFVCIHPTVESEIKSDQPGEWNQQGHLGKMLEVYKDFAPGIVKLLGMADEGTLKVWELLDMENLPTWTEGRLVCIGDAAHPFTPRTFPIPFLSEIQSVLIARLDQGQGAGQAIEDAASLAVVLPLGTPLSSIPSRLKLYEKCRYERASKIQEFSRLAGKDAGDGPPVDANKFVAYNFGHDEWDYSSQKLREFLVEGKDVWRRMPLSFGPMPGPRQSVLGMPHEGRQSTFTTASIKIRTSKTLLQNLLPTSAFKFSSPATNAYATFSVTTLENMAWLGGKGYSHFGLYIHGVEYTSPNGETARGTYLPILFENLADPILSGREELGMPKLWCELNVQKKDEKKALYIGAGWLGEQFCALGISKLEEVTDAPSTGEADAPDEGLMWYKYIPRSGILGDGSKRVADAEYAVFLPNAEEAKVEKKVEKMWKGTGEISFDKLDTKRLPTLHHVVDRLAEIPVYEVVEAKVVIGRGVSDVSSARVLW
jgi:2-polyprenyl-6-methoxyphenol hydroxylase-like FAD-dependent oxidoreductase